MRTLSEEKRKNGPRRRFQWWLLVIGFVLGVVVTVVARPAVFQSSVFYREATYREATDPALYLTATAVIQDATARADGAGNLLTPAVEDPLRLTATAIVDQATRQAGS